MPAVVKPKDRRKHVVALRLTTKQLAALKRMAKADKLTLSSLMQAVVVALVEL